MSADVKPGFSASIYVRAGGTGGGGWTLVTLAREATLTFSRSEIDVSSRGGAGWRERISGLRDISVELSMLDATDDDAYGLIRTAYLDGLILGLRCLNGEFAAAGVEGIQMNARVFNFTRGEPLEDALTLDVTFMNTRASVKPVWIPE